MLDTFVASPLFRTFFASMDSYWLKRSPPCGPSRHNEENWASDSARRFDSSEFSELRCSKRRTKHARGRCRCVCVCVCVNLPGTWEQRVSPSVFIQHLCRGTEGLQGSSAYRSSPPATQENVPASPAPGPRCGQLAGHSLSFTFHFISCYVIPLCLT